MTALRETGVAPTVAIGLRQWLQEGLTAFQAARVVQERALKDPELFLDAIDATLYCLENYGGFADELRMVLETGASVWTVAPDKKSLTGVVEEEAQAVYEQATSVHDDASAELRTAWANAFGRNGDPSDAWDHAIKAVEDTLIPMVVPRKAKANLGDVLGTLGSPQSSGQWQMLLPGADKSHDVAPLVAMLRLMWPNHDRHGGTSPKRVPSQAEARAVVTLAATIVQWHRDSWVVQKR
ncbi:hypothetical protein A6410_05090 [Prescottella equi]|uniref:hypothetical protein n=1 Tax=Rhodococcus hoagii TaxID=43767 RepID=UPI0009BC9084|nr:hypothetical protein [Prescottella equi]OQQ31009.1 hypothetical protein A6410_05090 [Prescottella equi]